MNPLTRRRFLQYLAGSNLALTGITARGQDILLYQSLADIGPLDPGLPRSLAAVSGLMELEKLAELVLPPAHFGYIYSGAGNGESKQANSDAYLKWDVLPRRLQGIESIDLSTTIFGERWSSPFFLSPTNGHLAFHPLGEVASAQGASAAGVTQMLSSLTTTPIEAVNDAKSDKPVWFQLYPTNDERVRYELVRRAEAAGSSTVVVTVDDIGGRGSEIAAPMYNSDTRDCTLCHQRELGTPDFLARKQMFIQYKDRPGFNIGDNALDFDDIRRLRDQVKGRLLVKGIMHPQDALDCLAAGVDGIVVSNHGGRIDSGGVGTLDALPAIADAVKGKLTILLDGGMRRGIDAFKALALGADAVGYGRPYLWGLAAYGADGVAATVRLLEAELIRAMYQAGAATIADISADRLQRDG